MFRWFLFLNYACDKRNNSAYDVSVCAYCVGTFFVCLFVLQSTVHGIRGEKLPLRTSIDLELDLQASKTKYTQLHDEIRRLRELHSLLENAKAKGLKIQTFDVWLFLKKQVFN